MKVTYLGTTVLLFDDGQDQILFDCHITRPSLLRCFCGSLRTDTAVADKVIRDFKIDRLKAIFVSHTHHDHVMDAPYFASKCGAAVYGSPSAVNVALGGGVSRENLYSYRDSMEYTVGGFRIRVLPSVHSIAHWYNNDLGQTIDRPLTQPAKKKDYKEGGSFDFLVEHGGQSYLIRPSYNYLEGQLDGIKADVVFLGIGGLSKDTPERRKRFYGETLEKVRPRTVIPLHWDNFFTPLYHASKWMTGVLDKPQDSIDELQSYCRRAGIEFVLQLPLSSREM